MKIHRGTFSFTFLLLIQSNFSGVFVCNKKILILCYKNITRRIITTHLLLFYVSGSQIVVCGQLVTDSSFCKKKDILTSISFTRNIATERMCVVQKGQYKHILNNTFLNTFLYLGLG